MLHRINKAQPALWRDPNTLQIGLPPNNIALENLTLEQQRIVQALYIGIVQGQESAIDSIAGARSGESANLIEKLSPLLELESQTSSNQFGDWQRLAFAEISRASLDYQVNGEMVLAERWQRNIHIDQLDRTGWLLVRALLASGIGSVITHDNGVVLNTDLGELGFPKEQLNLSRVNAAKGELAKFSLPKTNKERLTLLRMAPKHDSKVSFAILVGHLVLNPSTYARWNNRDVPHLAITYGLNSIEVSPIVTPGKTGCLNCYQQTKIDEDVAWPTIASQLLDLPRMRDDSAALLTSTGLASKLILRAMDLEAGFKLIGETIDLEKGYRINQTDGIITRVKYDFHPDCSCQEPG
jgi:hypothetical protein